MFDCFLALLTKYMDLLPLGVYLLQFCLSVLNPAPIDNFCHQAFSQAKQECYIMIHIL